MSGTDPVPAGAVVSVDVGVPAGVDVGVPAGVDVGVPAGVVSVGAGSVGGGGLADVVSAGAGSVGAGSAGTVPGGVSVGTVPGGVEDAPGTPVGVVVAVAGSTVQVDGDVAGGSGVAVGWTGGPVAPEATGTEVFLTPGRMVPSAGEDDEVVPGTDGAGAGAAVEPDAGGWHWADDPGPGAVLPGPPVGPEVLAGLGPLPVAPPFASAPVPSVVVCVPAPLVPAPCCDRAPAGSSTALAAIMARRTGCTPSETLAMTAMPARPVASQSTPMRHVPSVPGSENVSPLLLGFSVGMLLCWRGRRASRGRCARAGGHPGQAQCPRQVQNLTRSTAAARTASSQGRGGRLPMRARMLSSPSAPGSIPPTASDRARRSAPSRPSSGEDGFSSTCPPGHRVSCTRVDLSAAIARAV
jgi:hypothetical protein